MPTSYSGCGFLLLPLIKCFDCFHASRFMEWCFCACSKSDFDPWGLSARIGVTGLYSTNTEMELHGDKDVPRAAAQFGNGNDLLIYVLRDFYLQYMCFVWFNHGGGKSVLFKRFDFVQLKNCRLLRIIYLYLLVLFYSFLIPSVTFSTCIAITKQRSNQVHISRRRWQILIVKTVSF